MDELVGTYYDEWKAVVEDPQRQKQFRQFVNTVCLPRNFVNFYIQQRFLGSTRSSN